MLDKIDLFKLEWLQLLQKIVMKSTKVLVVIVVLFLLIYFKANNLSLSPRSVWTTNQFNDILDSIRNDLQYSVIIDAGSSGSRVFIYVWPPHSGDSRQLLDIRTLRDALGKNANFAITPGLSSCADNPSNASNYIEPLLRYAATNIPKHKHESTPLYILATAGMRLLDLPTQNAILDDLRQDIPKNYSFQFVPNNVAVISGRDEGVYSWISINYLMGRFNHTLEKAPMVTVENEGNKLKRMNTISVIEMGGASVQIASEITSDQEYNELKFKLPEDAFKNMTTEFNLGWSEHDTNYKYRLFVTTFLNLGANEARKNYVDWLINASVSAKSLNTSLSMKETMLYDPCLVIDSSETIKKTHSNLNQTTEFLYHLKGSGDAKECEKILQRFTSTNRTSSFVDLQKLNIPFKDKEFYGLSEFFYTMEDIYRMGGAYVYSKFHEATSRYCSTSWLVTQDRAKRKLFWRADFERLLHQCFKASWISSVLHEGFKMPREYSGFKSVYQLADEPVQWTLGALIFRTRFFPLRSINGQQVSVVHHVHRSPIYLYGLFILCILLVILFIGIYLRRLHTMPTTNYFTPDNIESYPLFEEQQPPPPTANKPTEHLFINFS